MAFVSLSLSYWTIVTSLLEGEVLGSEIFQVAISYPKDKIAPFLQYLIFGLFEGDHPPESCLLVFLGWEEMPLGGVSDNVSMVNVWTSEQVHKRVDMDIRSEEPNQPLGVAGKTSWPPLPTLFCQAQSQLIWTKSSLLSLWYQPASQVPGIVYLSEYGWSIWSRTE